MVCTTLTVQPPTPIVTKNSVGFGKGNPPVPVDPSCIEPGTIIGQTVGFIANVTVTNASANFQIKVDWTANGVARGATVGVTGQQVGTWDMLIPTTITYAVGTYSALTATILNVTAG